MRAELLTVEVSGQSNNILIIVYMSIPDWSIHNFEASSSIDRRFRTKESAPIDDSEGSKL